jgi:hypothetical protein
MLINDDKAISDESGMLAIIATMNGNDPDPKRLQQGVYQIGHFGMSGPGGMELYNEWPDLKGLCCYGVCDNVEQILKACPELKKSQTRSFMITLTPVKRANQPSEGGWRWHKWGEYIGDHDPQCEYIYDEKGIEQVFVYHIYERKN